MDAPYNLATGLPEQVSFVGPAAKDVLSRLLRPVTAWIVRRHRVDQISRALNRRTDRQLADMGLTRADIPAVARGLPAAAPRQEFDGSVKQTSPSIAVLPIALMR